MRCVALRLGLFGALLFGIPTVAQAQDALAVAPGVYKQVLDNVRMRVLQATLRPGDKVALHSHPDHMIYMLTGGALTIRPPGRTPYEMSYDVGEAVFLAGQTRELSNDGDKLVRMLIVELKSPPPVLRGAGRGTKRSSGRGKPRQRR